MQYAKADAQLFTGGNIMKWKDTTISPDGTHHLIGSAPLYTERFDEVLAFHEPGLAPVSRNGLAWHIRMDGMVAYERRFLRTFGFYEDFASVVSKDGWHHIRTDGSDLYKTRHDWCGSFQCGRCAVREPNGLYLHITNQGIPAYDTRWRYTGDYRYGIAVAQSEDGRSSHIDLQGNLIHSAWFLDLDVFHKGFARARDADGCMHIDKHGKPIYQRRFAVVEPFYNGQARVERFDGGLEVIDEAGTTIWQLRDALRSPFDSLSADIVGYWRTFALATAVKLDVLEFLPSTTQQVSKSCQVPIASMARLLSALAELRVIERHELIWRPTERGELLRREHPTSLAPAALEYTGPLLKPWEHLDRALKAPEKWEPPDPFSVASIDSQRTDVMHHMIQSYAIHDYARVGDKIDWSRHRKVIDAGGGTGTVVVQILRSAPDLEAVLLERPEVLSRAIIPEDIAPRLTLRAGDIFAPWEVKANAIILGRVLHDWNQDRCLKILRHTKESLEPGGLLYLIEMIRDGDDGALCDLHLFVNTGGAERTRSQYEYLLNIGGFRTVETVPLGTVPSILIAEAY